MSDITHREKLVGILHSKCPPFNWTGYEVFNSVRAATDPLYILAMQVVREL
jgi:hypothetical protein